MVYTWSELFWIFYIYSFIGWCAGVIANTLSQKAVCKYGIFKYSSLSDLWNYWSCVLYFLAGADEQNILLFLGGCAIAFVIIVVTSFILERAFNTKWWDYS